MNERVLYGSIGLEGYVDVSVRRRSFDILHLSAKSNSTEESSSGTSNPEEKESYGCSDRDLRWRRDKSATPIYE